MVSDHRRALFCLIYSTINGLIQSSLLTEKRNGAATRIKSASALRGVRVLLCITHDKDKNRQLEYQFRPPPY